MDQKHSSLVGMGYVVAAVLVVFPLVDLLANVVPITPERINWRYGSYGLASGFVLTVVLGMGLAFAMAAASGDRTVIRVLAVISVLGGLGLIVTGGIYVLDALQLRDTVSNEARSSFLIGTVKALFKNGISGLALIWIAWAGWRGSAAAKGETQKRTKEKPLVSGVS